jgi:hypothetical protein
VQADKSAESPSKRRRLVSTGWTRVPKMAR